MSQKIGEQGNVHAFFNEAFGKTVPEGVGMHYIRINPIQNGQGFQLAPDTGWSNAAAEAV